MKNTEIWNIFLPGHFGNYEVGWTQLNSSTVLLFFYSTAFLLLVSPSFTLFLTGFGVRVHISCFVVKTWFLFSFYTFYTVSPFSSISYHSLSIRFLLFHQFLFLHFLYGFFFFINFFSSTFYTVSPFSSISFPPLSVRFLLFHQFLLISNILLAQISIRLQYLLGSNIF